VDEQVLPLLGLDEPIALAVVEPLDDAHGHGRLLLLPVKHRRLP